MNSYKLLNHERPKFQLKAGNNFKYSFKKIIIATVITIGLAINFATLAQPKIQREYQIKGSTVIDSKRKIIFSICAYGKQLENNVCLGDSEKFTYNEIIDAIKYQRLNPWRVPSEEELTSLLKYFAQINFDYYSKNEKYWTSTKSNDGSVVILSFFKPIFVDSTKGNDLSILHEKASRIDSAQLILVKNLEVDAALSFEKGRVVGAYISAADLSARLASSQCGYVNRKENKSFSEKVQEVKQTLTSNLTREIDSFIKSQKFKKIQSENQKLIDETISQFKANGLDEKTVCGELWGNLGLSIHSAEQEWRLIKKY